MHAAWDHPPGCQPRGKSMIDKLNIGNRVRVQLREEAPGFDGQIAGIERSDDDQISNIMVISANVPGGHMLELDAELLRQKGFKIEPLPDAKQLMN